jgi:hypothetical protein
MTQNGGFDFLIAWGLFVGLLIVLVSLIVRRR